MNEWYVLEVGGKPVEVILGRKEAVEGLTNKGEFPVTPTERKQIVAFIEGVVCDLYSGLLVVGLVKNPTEDPEPDRRITRVRGPGAEV
jgi:hypothetical protein